MSNSIVRSMRLGSQPLVLPTAKPAAAGPVVQQRRDPPSPTLHEPVPIMDEHEEPAVPEEATEQQERLQVAIDDAVRTGYAEGRRQAGEEFRVEHERLLATAVELLRDLGRAHTLHYQALEAESVPVVVAAITQVFGELGRGQEFALAAVRRVLASTRSRRRLRLRIAPKHAEFVRLALAREDIGISAEDLEVVADASVSGGCMLDSDAGGIDASLETQLRRLVELLQSEGSHED